MIPLIQLKTLPDRQDIFPLVLQIATAPDQNDAGDLWQIGEQAEPVEDGNVCSAVIEEYRSLVRLFGFTRFAGIDWCVGNWSQGALSLVRENRVQIFSGSRSLTHRLEEINHIVRHELFHYFLRGVLHPDLHGGTAEEEVVQYHSRWEYPLNQLEEKRPLLERSRLAILRNDWFRLNETVRLLESR